MKQNVKLLIVFLMVLSISGCSGQPDIILKDCVTPDVNKPMYDNKRCNGILDKAKQCVRNHAIKDKYIKELEASNGVCK